MSTLASLRPSLVIQVPGVPELDQYDPSITEDQTKPLMLELFAKRGPDTRESFRAAFSLSRDARGFIDASLPTPSLRAFSPMPTIEGLTFFLGAGPGDINTTSLLMQAAYAAFAAHQGLTLSPELLWYTVMHEVGTFVGMNSDICAHLFTESRHEKIQIYVRDDTLSIEDPDIDWVPALELLRAKLGEFVPNIDPFLPKFESMNMSSEIAHLAAFMSAASNFYTFKIGTLCGIPRVILEGSEGDWALLHTATEKLAEMFKGMGLEGYLNNLTLLFEKLSKARAGGPIDEHFWKSIYKRSGESGGPHVNGWLTALFAFQRYKKATLRKDNEWKTYRDGSYSCSFTDDGFPAHLSKVDVVWDYFGREINLFLVSGVLGCSYDVETSTISPNLNWAILEAV